MTIEELRLEALRLAIADADRSGGTPKEIVDRASTYVEFLSNGAPTDKP